MQIFLSDKQPEKCARNLDDVRLRRRINVKIKRF